MSGRDLYDEIEILPMDPDASAEELQPISEMLADRERVFRRKKRKWEKSACHVIDVETPGPIAVAHFGDPHLDDDGCNIAELRRGLEVVDRTPHMYAGNVGDTTNNWPFAGRLGRLWAKQQATCEDAMRLGRWFYRSIPWLYYVTGNHDEWNNGGAVMRYLTAQARIQVMETWTARIELRFPKGRPIRIEAAHNFKGTSQWNLLHGPMKRNKMNPWADVVVCGHHHNWGEMKEEGEDTVPRVAMRVRGFKHFDSYAKNLQFHEHAHGHIGVTILDPLAKPTERVKVLWDIEEAADFLTWKRERLGLKGAA